MSSVQAVVVASGEARVVRGSYRSLSARGRGAKRYGWVICRAVLYDVAADSVPRAAVVQFQARDPAYWRASAVRPYEGEVLHGTATRVCSYCVENCRSFKIRGK